MINKICSFNSQQLEMELKKLQGVIQEGGQTFDDTLNQFFQLKIKTEMAIYHVKKCCLSFLMII